MATDRPSDRLAKRNVHAELQILHLRMLFIHRSRFRGWSRRWPRPCTDTIQKEQQEWPRIHR